MNNYYKYVPNVWLARCSEPHQRGEVIILSTKSGKENECVVCNLIFEKDGYYYYSVTRADGCCDSGRRLLGTTPVVLYNRMYRSDMGRF